MTTCRNATLAELDLILEWAASEGWNPGLEDAAAFFAADQRGFFVAVDDQDQPIAAISVVNHTADFAFLGLYIVTPSFRGQGTGLALWNHALAHAGDRTIGLDGVAAQQKIPLVMAHHLIKPDGRVERRRAVKVGRGELRRDAKELRAHQPSQVSPAGSSLPTTW